MFSLFYDEFKQMDDQNKLLLESIMVQNGVDEIFTEMSASLKSYRDRGPVEVGASNLMLTLDLTSACLAALDTAWSAIDLATVAATVLSEGVALPAAAESIGVHLTIKVIHHVIDGGLPTELKNVYLSGVDPDEYIQLTPGEPREFTMVGTFGAQETIMVAELETILDSCLAGMDEWLPDITWDAIIENILDVLSGMGLEGWMSFLGDDFTHIGAIPDFDLQLDFDWFANPFDLGSMVGRTMFQGCSAPMVALLNTLGGYFCSSGVWTTCLYDECIDWEFNYEKVQLTATENYIHDYDYIYFKWFVYEPSFLGLELPTSQNHTVHYKFQIRTPTPTPVPMNFVYIPSGTFQMGSPDDEMCRDSDEGPVHSVTMTHGFYMQSTEVTQQQWVDVFGSNPSYYSGMNRPVEEVTWYDSCIYCNRLSQVAGLTPCYYSDASFTTVFDGTPPVTSGSVYWNESANGYRLPTEAEWEYACRAGTTTAYNSGQDNTDCNDDPNLDPLGRYWYNGGSSDHHAEVGSYQANSWGLYDMHGNVWEWCWDWYSNSYYGSSPSTDPTGPTSGWYRVFRGGSWSRSANGCRSANRDADRPDNRSRYLGFRFLRETY